MLTKDQIHEALHDLESLADGSWDDPLGLALKPARDALKKMLNATSEEIASITVPHCSECKRSMGDHEIGDEFPEERVCDICARVGV